MSEASTAFFTSPRLRGEVDRAISVFTRVFDALWRGRVRWAVNSSECFENAPHPDPPPAGAEREKRARRGTHA
jgi:hypothetical protein